MTAYEALKYSTESLGAVNSIKQAIRNGQKRDLLPIEIQDKISDKNVNILLQVQKNALAAIDEELKQWYE
jgi:hypothetical protein